MKSIHKDDHRPRLFIDVRHNANRFVCDTLEEQCYLILPFISGMLFRKSIANIVDKLICRDCAPFCVIDREAIGAAKLHPLDKGFIRN